MSVLPVTRAVLHRHVQHAAMVTPVIMVALMAKFWEVIRVPTKSALL